ncbi:MAG: TetR/AcrR family transcriptional regulator [Planctomycetota bacterium]
MARMRAEERRRQLLEVAADLFARRGYRGTTTAELARAAGISEPILYRHFENKLDLFVTLLDEVGREVIEAWKKAMEGVDDPVERLRVLLAGNPATHERGQGVYRVIFQAMTDLEQDPAIAAALRRHLGMLHRFVADQLRSLQGIGVVRDDEGAGPLAWVLVDVAIGHGMISPLRAGGPSRSGRAEMQQMVEELLRG